MLQEIKKNLSQLWTPTHYIHPVGKIYWITLH